MDFAKYAPMLAVSGGSFSDQDYLFEIKWDGIRAIAIIEQQSTRLYSRNGNEISYRYPELNFTQQVSQVPAVLDGEIIVLKDGLPSFHTLQMRDHFQDSKKISQAVQEIPAIYMVFDILNLGGKELTQLPLIKRKEVLSSSVRESPYLVISQYIKTAGQEFFQLIKEKGLEGVVAKRLDSAYQCGKRSNAWIKTRNTKSISCIICGYVQGQGSRSRLGSLILGLYDRGRLRYVGNVGSGLRDKDIDFLLNHFSEHANTSPFVATPPVKHAVYVTPKLVCEVQYLERVEVLRHPTFVGLRADLQPKDCSWEQE